LGCASTAPGSTAPATATPGTEAAAGGAGGVTYGGGDGLTCNQRVEILGTTDEKAGVAAEYTWLKQHYPGHKLLEQALGDCRGYTTDKVLIRTAEGKMLTIHFDISGFFGKAFRP